MAAALAGEAPRLKEMATYDDRQWILSHIQNSYVTSDDTGGCGETCVTARVPGGGTQQTATNGGQPAAACFSQTASASP